MQKQSKKNLSNWLKYYRLNRYYHNEVEKIAQHLIPADASVLEFGSKAGEFLKRLPNKLKVGVENDKEMVKYANKKNKNVKFFYESLGKRYKKKYDYIVLSHTFNTIDDAQSFIKSLKPLVGDETRVVVFYFNYFWKPFLDLAEKLHLKLPETKQPNWLQTEDVDNFFNLENFEKIKSGNKFILPYDIPGISNFVNKYISQLPSVNNLGLIKYSVFRPVPKRKEYSVSILIPARNEAGNMKGVLKKIPKFGKKTEIVFVEGHSKDNTYQVIAKEIEKYKGKFKCKLYKQKGVGKGDAVRLGFSKSRNDVLMILDADLTVDPKELPKFYEVISSGKGEFVMGSRLVYPMEKQAMRVLNQFGNRFFSKAFTFLLGQRVKDTLCGTKVLLKKNYDKIAANRKYFGDFDPFGDYDLIFGASKLNLKIVEIPIRYKERTYGTTNISRFKHGLLLLRMVGFAAKKLKFT